MQGYVKATKTTKRGTPMIQVGDQWYFKERELQNFPDVGREVNLEYKTFGDKGDMRSITSWSYMSNAAKPSGNASSLDDNQAKFISNVIGQAVACKAINDCQNVIDWYWKLHDGLLNRKSPVPGVDDRGGFDEDENLPF